MKAAILGTTNYHATMQQIAQNALQPKFFPITETNMKTVELPPVENRFCRHADSMVKAFTSDNTLTDCNPRSPYLLLSWMFIGTDNDYRLIQYMKYGEIQHAHREFAVIGLKIALGDFISEATLVSAISRASQLGLKTAWQFISVMSIAANNQGQYLDRAVQKAVDAILVHLVRCLYNNNPINVTDENHPDHVAMKVIREQVREYFANKMQEWAYISDEEAGLIARQLLFDILDAGK